MQSHELSGIGNSLNKAASDWLKQSDGGVRSKDSSIILKKEDIDRIIQLVNFILQEIDEPLEAQRPYSEFIESHKGDLDSGDLRQLIYELREVVLAKVVDRPELAHLKSAVHSAFDEIIFHLGKSACGDMAHRYQQIMDALPVGVAMGEFPGGEILYHNSAAVEFLGHPLLESSDYTGYKQYGALHEDRTPYSPEEYPMARAVLKGETVDSEEMLYRRGDGRLTYFSVSARRIYFSPSGGVAVSTFQDINQRKVAERKLKQALREAKKNWKKLQMALQRGHMAMCEYDSQNESISWGVGIEKILELPKEDVVRDLRDLVRYAYVADKESFAKTIRALAAPQTDGIATHYRFKMPDETIKWIEFRGSLSADRRSHRKIWQISMVDISQIKRYEHEVQMAKERAEFASAAKTQFLANMSHELRTPLAVILGVIDSVLEGGLEPEETQDLLEMAHRNGKELRSLIDRVLDLAKIEAGALSIEKSEFSLKELIDDLKNSFKLIAQEKGIDFIIESEGDIPARIQSDATHLRQILINLLSNAFKFTDQGSVSLTVRIDSSVKDPSTPLGIEFVVKDTGIGLSVEDKEKLFKPFSQADSSHTRRFGGTGLGLFLSRRLCQALGGDIEIGECHLGRGCTFVARVLDGPAREHRFVDLAELDASEHREKSQARKNRPLEGVQVLLVEDSVDARRIAVRFLEQAGAEVDTAGDGREAVEKALHADYDVILMDIQMPVMDGLQAFDELKKRSYSKPVIALTAHALRSEKESALSRGFYDYFTKPMDRLKLIAALSDLG